MPHRRVERRAGPRQRSFLGATIEVRPNWSSTQCILRDVTRGGGRLSLSEAVPLPDRFTVVIPHLRETREARLIWRRGDQVGVAFDVPRESGVVISLTAVRDLRLAKAENDLLRAQIAARESLD